MTRRVISVLVVALAINVLAWLIDPQRHPLPIFKVFDTPSLECPPHDSARRSLKTWQLSEIE
jgi:hypothetical protein